MNLFDKNNGYNEFLDDVLDGKPFYHVDTPEFRTALRKRAWKRKVAQVANFSKIYGYLDKEIE